MEARHFDQLTRALNEAGTRRGLLGLLATLPVFGGLVALLADEETDAKGRRKRRKKRHQHQKGDGKQNRKGKRKGKGADKTEACDGVVCLACETCQDDGNCSAPCNGSGCCAGDTCLAGTDVSACGTGGAACVECTGMTPSCDRGTCVACSATNPCPSGLCCVGGQCVASCPACQTCSSGLCQAVPNDTVACDGSPLEEHCVLGGLGVCVDGACSCADLVHDPTNGNRCLCNAERAAGCASGPGNNCCAVTLVCNDGGWDTTCVACP